MQKPLYIDLHTHSTASDGSFSPGELPALAAQAGLAAVALTDHDTIGGVAEFMAAGQNYPELETIPGVELSTNYCSRELHIVGLYIDCQNPVFLDFLAQQRAARTNRNVSMAKKLASLGYPVDLAALGGAGNESLGRPHFARYLVEHYNFPTLQSVFDKLLKAGCAAYVKRENPGPFDAIDAIHQAGGLAVWAHPVYRGRNESSFVRRMLKKLVPAGLDALEAYYSLFGPAETNMLLAASEIQHIGRSGGSDFHGANTPNIQIGLGGGALHVPYELLLDLKQRLKARREQ